MTRRVDLAEVLDYSVLPCFLLSSRHYFCDFKFSSVLTKTCFDNKMENILDNDYHMHDMSNMQKQHVLCACIIFV